MKYPQTWSVNNDIAVGQSKTYLLQAGKINNTVYKYKGVLIGIFDTGNYSHIGYFLFFNNDTKLFLSPLKNPIISIPVLSN